MDPETLSEYAANLARTDPKVQSAIQYERQIGHLREDAGWQLIMRRIKEQRETFMLRLAQGLMAGKPAIPEEIAFNRGFYEGALFAVSQPEQAAENLDRAARAAVIRTAVEEEEGENAPYT